MSTPSSIVIAAAMAGGAVGTRDQEYTHNAEGFKEIITKYGNIDEGAYYGLAFLLDSGYGREEMKIILDKLYPYPKNASPRK